MKIAVSSETLVRYKSTRCHNSENHNFYSCDNFNYHYRVYFFKARNRFRCCLQYGIVTAACDMVLVFFFLEDSAGCLNNLPFHL